MVDPPLGTMLAGPGLVTEPSSSPAPPDQLTNRRNQVGGYDHYGLPLCLIGGFVFGQRLVRGLVLVMRQDFSDPLLVPAARELLPVHPSPLGLLGLLLHLRLLRCRRRYPFRGCPERGQDPWIRAEE